MIDAALGGYRRIYSESATIRWCRAPCTVTLTDLAGIRHAAEVNGESLFEAAFLVLRAFKASGCTERIGPATRVEGAMAARWTPMR